MGTGEPRNESSPPLLVFADSCFAVAPTQGDASKRSAENLRRARCARGLSSYQSGAARAVVNARTCGECDTTGEWQIVQGNL